MLPTRPSVGVGVIAWLGPSVLLIRRSKPPKIGQWSLPGGHVEWGEAVRDAAQRELMEETGVAVASLHLVDVVDLIEGSGTSTSRHYTLVDFTGAALSPDLQAGSDASDARWFAPDELSALSLWDATRRVIAQAWQVHCSHIV